MLYNQIFWQNKCKDMNVLLILAILLLHVKAFDNGKKIIINLGLPQTEVELIQNALVNVGIRVINWASPPQLCPKSSFPVHNVTVGGIDVPRTFYPAIYSSECFACVVIQRALAEGKPPLHYFIESNITAFLQIECLLTDMITNKKISIWPQFQMLDELYKSYPSAYFIHTRRDSTKTHVELWTKWHNLVNRLQDHGLLNHFKGQLQNKSQIENAMIFVNEVHEMVYSTIKKHPDIKFLDVCMDCPHVNISQELSKFLNLPKFKIPQNNFISPVQNIRTNVTSSHGNSHFSCSLSDYIAFISNTLLSSTFFNSKTCKVQNVRDIVKNGYCNTFKFYSPEDAIALLKGTTIHAVGDSITRRLFIHLHQYLLRLPFVDNKNHDTLKLSIKLKSWKYSIIGIIFHWAPTITNKIAFLQRLISDSRSHSQHFIHIGGPDHDFAHEKGEEASPKLFYDKMNLFNSTIYKLNRLGAFITIDGVLQFDDDKNKVQNHKSSNEIVVANRFYSKLYGKQNYFGYIDLWDWILLQSRKHCMGRDGTGVHFVNNDVRLLHVQAFLNYVSFFKNHSHA